MNQNKPFMKSSEAEVIAEPVVPEIEDLEERGFSAGEIVSLVWLRDWY
jgi:hypothetical protein